MAGQVLRRDEADGNSGNGDPHEIWYRYDGRQIGYTGNNGTLDTEYHVSIGNRTMAPFTGSGAFRNNSAYSTPHADFAQSLDPINSYEQGSSGGSYVARAGDTLQGIALQLWGDASLWYKLAEVNGLSAGSALIEGQSLVIPAGAMSSLHNADTFKPYDPASAIGDTSPTASKAPKKAKCGGIGMVLVALVAVAVSIALPHLSAFFAKGAGLIIGGMISSAVSQGFGVATGIQNKFDWKGVAMAGITAGGPSTPSTACSAMTRPCSNMDVASRTAIPPTSPASSAERVPTLSARGSQGARADSSAEPAVPMSAVSMMAPWARQRSMALTSI